MTQITSFDKNVVRSLRVELDAELAALGEKYGLKIRTGNATLTQTSVTYKLELTVEGGMSHREERTSGSLELYANAYLPGVDITKEYKHPTVGLFKITGWNTRARTQPVMITTHDGKHYKMPVDQILRLCK